MYVYMSHGIQTNSESNSPSLTTNKSNCPSIAPKQSRNGKLFPNLESGPRPAFLPKGRALPTHVAKIHKMGLPLPWASEIQKPTVSKVRVFC